MIHNQQNQEQNYEKLLITQKKNEEQKQKVFDEQDKTRIDLQIKINQAYGLFAALKKKQFQSAVTEKSADGTTVQAKEIDLDALLSKLRAKISSIHTTHIAQGEAANKSTL